MHSFLRNLIFLFPVLAVATSAQADFIYVDAVDGVGGNTTLVGGGTLLADDTTGGTTWRQRDNVDYGSSGTVFEGVDPSPTIVTTITGLSAGAQYDIIVNFWDPDSTAEDWNVKAGFTAGGLTTYTREAGALAGAVASGLTSSLTYGAGVAPTLLTSGGRTNLAAALGSFTADANGKIEVFIDDYGSANVNQRTWYDGISYQLVTASPTGAITYIDATLGNVTRWDGQPFNPAAQGNTLIDNNWETRTFGNSGGIYESNADGGENAPLLVTTITGLTPNSDYVLYAYFWDDGRNWRLKASAKIGDIQNNGTPGNLSDDFLPTSPLTNFAGSDYAGGTATIAPAAIAGQFVTLPLILEGNRTLHQVSLGKFTSDGSGTLRVYIDDLAGVTEADRTWFDGVGYKTAVPLVPTEDEDGDSLTNAEEETAGTNPYIVDTDGDTYGDGTEIAGGSNPLNPGSVPPLPGNSLQITADGAWTWFNDERAIFHQGNLFVGYVKGNGQYGVTRYDPVTNTTYDMIISTGTSQEQDDHNNPSITVLPSGNLMVLYAKHLGGSQFYQRTSLVNLPSSDADWSVEKVNPLTDNNTYNNTYILSAESNRIYNFHRNINFNPTITYSDNLGDDWDSVQFIEVGTGNVRPYPRYCSNHTDRVDLIYTDGHPRDLDNSVYHMYYESDVSGTLGGGSFYKTDGTLVDSFANLPLDHQGGQRGSVVYQYSSAAWGPGEGPNDWIPNARGWTWDVHYGADGNPVCVFQVQVGSDNAGYPNSRIYYYYARWTGSEWQKRFIAQAGRGIYAAESDYGGGMTIDPENTNVIYISSNAMDPFDLGDVNTVPLNTGARFEIYRGVTNDGGLTFTWEALTENSAADNLRPVIPENSPYDRTLVWFNGTYNSYTSFNTKVLALLENDLKLQSSSIGATSATLTWDSSPGHSYRIGGSVDLNGFPVDVATGVESQGGTTSHTFGFPSPILGSPKGFFRVEEE